GGTEVPLALLLSKSASGNNAYTGGLDHAFAVIFVGLLPEFQGLSDGLGRESDCWEEIHGALGLLALDALHLLECFVEGESAGAETVVNSLILRLVECVRRLAFLWWVDHETDKTLANNGRAEEDGNQLVNLSADLGTKSDE